MFTFIIVRLSAIRDALKQFLSANACSCVCVCVREMCVLLRIYFHGTISESCRRSNSIQSMHLVCLMSEWQTQIYAAFCGNRRISNAHGMYAKLCWTNWIGSSRTNHLSPLGLGRILHMVDAMACRSGTREKIECWAFGSMKMLKKIYRHFQPGRRKKG